MAALVVVGVVLGGAAGLIGWATSSIDRIEAAKEQSLVSRRLSRTLDGLVEDLNSATIWDDSVVALSGTPDLEWLQTNFGDYYADYMQHAVTLTYDGSGRIIQASRDSEPVPSAQEAAFAKAVEPLAAEVRLAAADPARRRAVGFEAVVNRTAIVQVGGQAWLAAGSTVVPESHRIRRPAADAVVISAQPMSVLLDSMRKDLGIHSPDFAETPGEGQIGTPVSDLTGRPFGFLVWTPDQPGQSLLRDAAMVMAAVLLVLIAAAGLLWIRVDRIARRLARNEADLTEARDRAEAANVAKSRFLANMSHELRTPLNGVVAMAEIMAAGELSPIQRNHLNILRTSGASLLELIERLLQVSRLERKEVLVDRAPFDPAASAAAAAEQYRAAAEAKGLKLTIDCLPTGQRLGDEMHLQQVLDFLVDNAITFTEAGDVRVEVRPCDGAVRFAVIDTGMGIDAELLPRLFDVFVQGDDSITRRFEGAGIGLSICRNLVEAMGGRIAVESALGAGSTFTVDLPLPLAKPVEAERMAA